MPWNKGKKDPIKRYSYTNGIKTIRLPIDENPPDGFIRGAKREKLTKDKKEAFKQKQRKTCLEKYGRISPFDNEKSAQTKLNRYGSSTYNNQQKASETCRIRYSVDHVSQIKEVREKIQKKAFSKETQQKYKNTCLIKYGNENINLVPSIRDKMNDTKRKNNSFNKSSQEEQYYQALCQVYSKNDVIRQYKSDKYPFHCDFYIKSEDLYIELNLHWTHGKMIFDENNRECQEKLAIWKEKAKTSKFYQTAIETWTIRDIKKIKTAIENSLNYMVIYSL